MSDQKLIAANIDIVTGGLTVTGNTTAGFEQQSITALVPGIIQVILGLLGIVTLCLAIYAGFLYLTSQGNKETVEKAKKILTYTALGMVVILSSFAISSFLLGSLNNLFTNPEPTAPPPEPEIDMSGETLYEIPEEPLSEDELIEDILDDPDTLF